MLTINRATPTAQGTNAATLTFAVAFNKPVTGVDAADFQLIATGSATGVVSQVVATGAANFTVTVANVAAQAISGSILSTMAQFAMPTAIGS